MHRNAAYEIDPQLAPVVVREAAMRAWDRALEHGEKYGYRNSQVTVLAPTGTIGFMMDCDTTGVEPDIALVKYKNLVGGGMFKYVNNTVPRALDNLGYQEDEVKAIVAYIDEHDTIEGAPYLKEEHLEVFDCAFKAAKGSRSIHYMGHLRMMGAVQPFISGAISKTVNMPAHVTVEEIEQAYIEAWKLGLKAVAIYRDGCKKVQPLNAGKHKTRDKEKVAQALDDKLAARTETSGTAAAVEPKPYRRRLPDDTPGDYAQVQHCRT